MLHFVRFHLLTRHCLLEASATSVVFSLQNYTTGEKAVVAEEVRLLGLVYSLSDLAVQLLAVSGLEQVEQDDCFVEQHSPTVLVEKDDRFVEQHSPTVLVEKDDRFVEQHSLTVLVEKDDRFVEQHSPTVLVEQDDRFVDYPFERPVDGVPRHGDIEVR